MKDRIKELRRVSAYLLRANPKNWRSHPHHQRSALSEVLEKIGFAGAVLARETLDGLEIIDGHLRVEQAGDAMVPVLVTDLSHEEAQQLLVVYDPLTHMAGRDDGMLASLLADLDGFASDGYVQDLQNLPAILDAIGYVPPPEPEPESHSDPDAIPTSAPARCCPGDLFRIGPHRLLIGDATQAADADRLLAGVQPQCIFTSPPYAVGIDYGAYQDTLANLRAMLPQLALLWKKFLVPGGYAVVNFNDIVVAQEIVGTPGPCEYPMAFEYWPAFRNEDWVLWSRRIWTKPTATVNSPWCMNGNRAAADWEHLWTWKAPGKPLITHQVTGEFSSQKGWIDSVYEVQSLEIGKGIHGAGMPVSVAAYFLETHSFAGGPVWEPFGGTGTTLVAAHLTGRVGYATELNPEFGDIILQRLEQLLGVEAERIG